MIRSALAATGAAALLFAGALYAAEFREALEPAVVLHDAPSASSKKLFVVNKGYPLEVVVRVDGWVKVRDAEGGFSWAEGKQLGPAAHVLARRDGTSIRQQPVADAAPVAEVQRGVMLEVTAAPQSGWVAVKHRDGAAGYLLVTDVWGL